MKKIISTLMVVVVLFNFIFGSQAYADTEFKGTDAIQADSITSEDQEKLVNEGTVNFLGNGVKLVFSVIGTILGAIAGIITIVINTFPMLMQVMMTFISGLGLDEFFTIEQAVFNQVEIFNINYFDFNVAGSSMIITLRQSIAKFFVIFRLIAVSISLLILIYVGIRMAMSTIAADKAKYKSMLIAWVESIILLFLMQYIISLIINIGEMFSNIIYDMKMTLDSSGEMSFETTTLDTIYSFMFITAGWNYVLYSIVFWFLVYIQSKFFLSYFKRVIHVGFLILIAPLITITYPIDKIGDGKAQAFSVWFNELSINVFIQPIHAIIYLVFMYTAGEIAQYSILVATVFLLSLTKVEKIILHLFNLKNVTSLKPVDEERKKGK